MSLSRRWTWTLDAPRERLWRYLADTDWVNRHAGLPAIDARYEPVAGGGARRFGSFKRGPFSVEWEERPTQWEAPSFFAVEREYRHGPLATFASRTALEDAGDARTRVVVDVRLEASSPLSEALLPLLAAHGRRGADRAFRLAATLARRDGAAAAEAAPLAEPWNRLRDAGAGETVVTRLASFVEAAEDGDLQRMRPYELAAAWGLPRRDVLRAFLIATRAGLFNLRWSVLCSSCRGPSESAASLSGVQSSYHCDSCNVEFGPVFDRSVEVTFDARPLGRATETPPFCIANPRRSPHVIVQTSVDAGGERTIQLNLSAGNYKLVAAGAGESPFAAEDGGVGDALARFKACGRVEVPPTLAAGALALRCVNELGREIVVRVEDGDWPDTVVTAAQVTALQEFRDMFSSEVLAPGLDLGIETLAVLFTDVVGSTAIYSRTGDAPAFRIVTDHFAAIRDTVGRHEGAIVKTIGDAVMAAFVDPVRCLEAALELDARVQTIAAVGAPLRLRVGFHAGPCIAMRANDRIDYFGTTVNLAARLQKLALAGEVTLARSVAERPGIAVRLQGMATAIARETLEIKGFPERIEVVRVRP